MAFFYCFATSLGTFFVFGSCGPGTAASTHRLWLKSAVSLISTWRNLVLLSLTAETWSPIFRPERPSFHPVSVQMSFCILQGLKPSAWDSFGQSPSSARQSLLQPAMALKCYVQLEAVSLSPPDSLHVAQCFLESRLQRFIHHSTNIYEVPAISWGSLKELDIQH